MGLYPPDAGHSTLSCASTEREKKEAPKREQGENNLHRSPVGVVARTIVAIDFMQGREPKPQLVAKASDSMRPDLC